MKCNQCGACCRNGGECGLRGWTPWGLRLSFTGVCELLTSDNRCTVVAEAGVAMVSEYTNFSDACTYPELRRHALPLLQESASG